MGIYSISGPTIATTLQLRILLAEIASEVSLNFSNGINMFYSRLEQSGLLGLECQCVCVCVCVSRRYLLNYWSDFDEIWYASSLGTLVVPSGG